MIYTVTLNPAVDYIMHVPTLNTGETNRSENEAFYLGGKGINVSIVLNNLGVESTTLGLLGGFSGAFIQEKLQAYQHIRTDFIKTNQVTRINVKLKGEQETEINGAGSEITAADESKMTTTVEQLEDAAIVVLAGSKAAGMTENWYYQTAKKLSERNIPFVIDIATTDLLELATLKPLLVKPNQVELETLFDEKCETEEDVISLAKKLYNKGAEHVIVSRGEHGAIMVCKTGVYTVQNPQGKLINSVGAGDSVVAGFIYGYYKKHDSQTGLKYGIACGSGTAYSEHLATKKIVDELLADIKIEQK